MIPHITEKKFLRWNQHFMLAINPLMRMLHHLICAHYYCPSFIVYVTTERLCRYVTINWIEIRENIGDLKLFLAYVWICSHRNTCGTHLCTKQQPIIDFYRQKIRQVGGKHSKIGHINSTSSQTFLLMLDVTLQSIRIPNRVKRQSVHRTYLSVRSQNFQNSKRVLQHLSTTDIWTTGTILETNLFGIPNLYHW